MNTSKEKGHEIITLTFFKNWHEVVKKNKLTHEQYGKLIYAMCEYCFYGIDTTKLEGFEGAIFDMAKSSIDASNRNKIEGSKGGKTARGKSGAPAGNDNASKKK